ncbi:hypothetical protein IW262DRAFT_1458286 [Armillaria fumosa]|nr:hypothetical protein IW262DRAFT_1458286 [Armillaria fumosa]
MVNGEWKRLKSHWSNWQFFMQAYQASRTPEAFWDTFSDSDGQYLKFSLITNILKEKRQKEDNDIVTEAVMIYSLFSLSYLISSYFPITRPVHLRNPLATRYPIF